jgi:eukaryotic-like serine/threonine-protein kinase
MLTRIFSLGEQTLPGETVILRPENAPSGDAGGSTPRVATEVHDSAVNRLYLVAAVVAVAFTFSLGIGPFVVHVLGGERLPREGAMTVVALLIIGLSLGVLGAIRSGRLGPAALVHLGLVYEVVGAGLMTAQSWYAGSLIQQQVLSINWVCIWIVAFPLVIPATPLQNVVASFLSASMGPLFLAICVLGYGSDMPSGQKLVMSFLPNYMSVAVAIVPAIVMYRLGRSLGVAEKRLEELGSYQLVEKLGQGGMGEVWRAQHRMLARPAAVKLVNLEREEESVLGREQLLRRFEMEAQSTASLHSPHTVSLYDFGRTSEGTFYYVMELLDGLDLESLVKRFGPLPPARAIHLLEQVCSSLAEAHAAGMIHRDIKPANIYLCRLGLEHDWVKVLDFGLVAKAKGCTSCTKEGAADPGRLTAANTIVGTPSFMAPEMAEGRPDIDGRADLYALGCVAYWLLTGTLVFSGPDKTPMKILMDHVGTPPEPPSKRLGKPLPADLEAVVLRCLEKDPRSRPPSASELARLLRECSVEGTWSESEARRWWQENLAELAAKELDTSALSSTVVRSPVTAA